MASINQETLIGELIPDVYISKISLESAGSPNIIDDPHINVKAEKISFDEKDTLAVKIELVIKEKLSNDLVGHWFDNIDFQKYLKVKIYQVTDPKLTALLSLSQDMLEIFEDGKQLDKQDLKLKMAGYILETLNLDDLRQKISSNTKKVEISLQKQQNKLTDFVAQIDNDGNRHYNIPYNVRFDLNNSNPEHLSYFILSFLDLKQLASDFSLEYDIIDASKQNGKVISEIVIDDFQVASKSFVFFTENGEIWPGPVHLTKNGQWRSGAEESSSSLLLFRETVVNNKIQDFRNIRDIQKLVYDFSGIRSQLAEIEIKVADKGKIDTFYNVDYFSDLHLTNDKNGDVKFFFIVNFEKLILDQTLFGGIVKRAGSRFIKELIENTKIRRMVIYRRRVKNIFKDNSLGIPTELIPFDINEPDEFIVISGEKDYGQFKEVNTPKSALREVNIVLDNDFPGIRCFTGMDKTASELTDGFYQYYIQMDVDDNTFEFVNDKLENLLLAKSSLQSYLEEAEFNIFSNRFEQSFINKMLKKYNVLSQSPWYSSVITYVDILDLLTDAFQNPVDRDIVLNNLIKFVSPKTGNPDGVNTVLNLMDHLISLLRRIIGPVQTESLRKRAYQSIKRSREPSISSSSAFKKTFNIVKYFNSLFDSNLIQTVAFDYLSSGPDDTENDDGIKKISINNYRKRVDLETLKYYKTTEVDLTLNFDEKQFFTKDKISNTSFSYLSPSRIDLLKRSFSLIETQQNQANVVASKKDRLLENINDGNVLKSAKFTQIQSAMTAQQVSRKPTTTLLDFSTTKDQNTKDVDVNRILTDYFGENLGIEVRPIRLELKSEKGASKVEAEVVDKISVNKNLGNLLDRPPLLEQVSVSNNDLVGLNNFLLTLNREFSPQRNSPWKTVKKNNRKSTELTALSPKKLVLTTDPQTGENTISGFKNKMSENVFNALPNQIKSILHFNASKGIVKSDTFKTFTSTTAVEKTENSAIDDLNFKFLKKIERLAGFKRGKNQEILIKSPIWIMLTEADYKLLIGKEIVCRMIDYEDQNLGIFKNQSIDKLDYDTLFILVAETEEKEIKTIQTTQNKTKLIDKVKISLKDSFPQLNIIEKIDNKNNNLANLLDRFDISEKNEKVRILDSSNKKTIKIGNKDIQVLSNIAVDGLIAEKHIQETETELLKNNIITQKSFNTLITEPKILNTIADKIKEDTKSFDVPTVEQSKFRKNKKVQR